MQADTTLQSRLPAFAASGAHWAAALTVAGLSLAAYFVTLAQGPGWADSAELALRAYQLGATHPPGAPLHTLLGALLATGFSEPAFATNLLSALATAGAAVILSLLIWEMTVNLSAAFFGPLWFALNPHVWSNAVVTEVYSLNGLLFGLAVLLAWRWYSRPSLRRVVAVAAAYGASLGTYFGNLLLLPAFVLLLVQQRVGSGRGLLAFAGVVGCAVVAIAAMNMLLSENIAPFGTMFVPDTMNGLIRYMSASQFDPTKVQNAAFYANRIMQHSEYFARNFLVIGLVPGLLGIRTLWKQDRPFQFFLLAIFLMDMGFFTQYSANDFFTMVTPAYFVFCIWIGFGIKDLVARWNPMLVQAVLAAALGILVGLQLSARVAVAQEDRVSAAVAPFMEAMPADAVVVASWDWFTSLVYFQTVHGTRDDITVLVPSREPRHYGHGEVDDYLEFVDAVVDSRPVFTNRVSDEFAEHFDVVRFGDEWFLVQRSPDPAK